MLYPAQPAEPLMQQAMLMTQHVVRSQALPVARPMQPVQQPRAREMLLAQSVAQLVEPPVALLTAQLMQQVLQLARHAMRWQVLASVFKPPLSEPRVAYAVQPLQPVIVQHM